MFSWAQRSKSAGERDWNFVSAIPEWITAGESVITFTNSGNVPLYLTHH